MKQDYQVLMQAYFDDLLSADQFQSLQEWLKQDPSHVTEFVECGMLHDKLRGQLLASVALRTELDTSASELSQDRASTTTAKRSTRMSYSRALTVLAIAASVIFLFTFWRSDSGSANAGQAELRKMIAANAMEKIQAFNIDVELTTLGGAKQKKVSPEGNRPPKPPMDKATLYLRGAHEFVLIRNTADGKPFITGCDGKTSWAMRPDGPVRVSQDLQRFNHDVPGHEFSLPLCNIAEALRQLQHAFVLSALPVELPDSVDDEPRRLLVAIKKRGYPGPRRVEITYLNDSGQIEQLRFIDMPYGQDQLTLRLTHFETSSIANDYFSHRAHHDSNQTIVSE